MTEPRESKLVRMRIWNDANRERLREYQKAYKSRNPERRRAQNRAAYARNKEVINERKRSGYYKGHQPAARREAKLLRKYGLTIAQWDALFVAQGSRCRICGTEVSGGNGWQTDHCHDSNVVRGILCVLCNTGIGKLRDDPALLRKAALYLEEFDAIE